MSQIIQGDLTVLRTINAGRRVNEGGQSKPLVGTETYDLHCPAWNNYTAAAPQDVILPDATTLALDWKVVVNNEDLTNAIAIKDNSSGLVKSIIAGRCYEFTCTDVSTPAGAWHITFRDQSDLIPSERYSTTFDATTSWGSPVGGYYSITYTAATHLLGTNPRPTLYILDGSDYDEVQSDQLKVLANGDVVFRVPQTPNGRFAGKIVIL